MTSGVKVADDVKTIFEEMKVVKSDADESKRVRVVVLTIDKDIVVKEVYRQKDLEGEDDILKFVQRKLPDGTCCYMLWDCHYETCESRKEDLVYITWTSQNSALKQKMLYSSSKCALSNVFRGVKHNFEFHDCCELDMCEIAPKLGKDITCIEGKNVRGEHKPRPHEEQHHGGGRHHGREEHKEQHHGGGHHRGREEQEEQHHGGGRHRGREEHEEQHHGGGHHRGREEHEEQHHGGGHHRGREEHEEQHHGGGHHHCREEHEEHDHHEQQRRH